MRESSDARRRSARESVSVAPGTAPGRPHFGAQGHGSTPSGIFIKKLAVRWASVIEASFATTSTVLKDLLSNVWFHAASQSYFARFLSRRQPIYARFTAPDNCKEILM